MTKSKFKKPIIIILALIVTIVTLVILFISPITKYMVEKYDEKYTGRKITMNWAYVNPFTGYIHFSNLKIYEPQSDSIFLSTDGLSANFTMRKILSKTYEIGEIELDAPKGIIIQHGKELNFDDLIKLFSPKKTSTPKEPVHFSIHSIKINNGEFHFRENEIPIHYAIKKVNCECSGFKWDTDTVSGSLSFLAGRANSDVKGNFTINYKTMDYRFAAIAKKFDLEIIDQYLKHLVNYGTFRANLDLNLKATGNFKDKEDIIAKGIVAVNDMHFGKDTTEDYFSFDKLVVDINELSPKHHKYLFDSLSLSHPYFKYERYDYLDNLQTMFGKKGANIAAAKANPEKFNLVIELARYVKVLSKNFFKSSYKINKLSVINADLRFNDYSLNEKFSVSAKSLNIYADSINKNQKRVEVFLKSAILPYGNLSIDLSINPKDSSDFDMVCRFQKVPATLFNPYLITYTSFPLDRGTIEFTGNWHVRNGEIQSTNHLLIMDPHLSEKVKRKDTKWIPMPLLMAFIRERGNVIDYEIPIKGNLKDPKFRLRDVLIDLAENILIKPPTINYGIRVSNAENEIEKSLTLQWKMRSSTLEDDQKTFVEKMARFLEKNPEASLSINPICYAEKEKEQILFFEAKKKYFLLNKKKSALNEEDSLTVNKMAIKDSLFVKFLDKHLNDSMMFTIQQKCAAYLNSTIVNVRYNQLLKNRENLFRSYFTENGTNNRVHIHNNENKVPYNGFSFYKIDYKGDIPESLISAYEEMNDLNSRAPRNRHRKERIKSILAPK